MFSLWGEDPESDSHPSGMFQFGNLRAALTYFWGGGTLNTARSVLKVVVCSCRFPSYVSSLTQEAWMKPRASFPAPSHRRCSVGAGRARGKTTQKAGERMGIIERQGGPWQRYKRGRAAAGLFIYFL
jgi:hypothetical protein